ncbi:MAG: nickel pincer cofactor biosynthesis protein LarC [Nitrososphaeraceae archaeon]|nr:nickel pincer cofactor biosynthesis protein LarC [Nitrososphaeraceae archaeon]
MGRIAVIDAQISGISGDMLLSSLVDAGANKKRVTAAIFACQKFLKGSSIQEVNFRRKVFGGFGATQLTLRSRDNVSARRGTEMYQALSQCCEHTGVGSSGRAFALESLKRIIVAESAVHGQEFKDVFLHESSSIDTLVDLIGCAVALEDLDLFKSRFFSTRIAVGSGQFTFSHGVVSNPGNAIIEIFKGLPFTLFGSPTEEEQTTPTGAAMLVTLSNYGLDYYPAISPEKTGYGAGQKCLKNVSNILRLVIGKSPLSLDANIDTVFVIETHIDDLSGELVGNLIEKLDKSGALDVSVLQGLSKKNRPNYIVKVISNVLDLNNILEILYTESGTLGARVQEVRRIVMTRNAVTTSMRIRDKSFDIRVKIARDLKGNVINVKPEFEDIKNISQVIGLPSKRIMDLVKAETIQRFGEA